MAGAIKGITIQFAGDTTKLDRSISEIENNTKKLDDELKKVNKALKFNPKSVELWRQKQELLTQKIGDTEEKLVALKKKQEEMGKAGVDKNSAEWRNLQREIIETESKLEHFNKQLKEVSNHKITTLGTQFEKLGKKITTVGDELTKKVTLPIVALGTASIAAFADVDKGMDAVTKRTGATGAALEEMQTIAKDLATELPVSFEDAGNAVGEVNTRFGVTGQELDDLTAQFLKFARLNDTDVTTSIDSTQKALAAFGLDASHAGELLDVMNAVGQKTGIDMDTLTTLLVKNGAQLQAMGLDAYQAAQFLGQVEVSGVDTTQAMQGMQKALKYASASGKDLDEVLSDFDAVMKSNASETEKLNKAYEIFGTKAGAALYNAAKNGTIAFDELGETMESSLGSVSGTFDNTLSATDRMKTTFNALKEAGYEIGAALGDVLVPILKKASEALKKFAAWFKNLSPQTKNLITKLGLLAAAAGPILSIIGRMTSGIGGIIKMVPNVISGVTKLASALVTNPYLAIAVGAAAAVAGIAALILSQTKITREYEKAKKAREEEIQGAYTQAATAEMYAQKLDELSQKENKSAADKQLMKTYVDQLNGSVEGLNLQYDAENDKLSQSTEQIYGKIEAYKQQVIQQAYANQMQTVANDLVQTEMELDDIRMQKKQANAELEKAIAEGDIDQQNYLIAKINDLGHTEEQLQAKQTGLMQELDKYADAASGNIEEVGTTMSDVADDASAEGNNVGENFTNGIAAGINAVVERAKQAARDAVAAVAKAARDAGEIQSPSKLMRDEVGKWLGLGIGEGILDSLPQVEKDAQKFINGTVNAMMSQPPETRIAGISATPNATISGANAGGTKVGGVNQTINIYQPVSTPAETARAIRQQEIIMGLAG